MNHLAFDAALTAVAVAASRGAEIPPELVQADQLVAQLRRLSGPSPEPPLPSISGLTAEELRDVLGQAARERVEREALRDVAGSLVGPSVADYLAQFRQCWPAWLPT